MILRILLVTFLLLYWVGFFFFYYCIHDYYVKNLGGGRLFGAVISIPLAIVWFLFIPIIIMQIKRRERVESYNEEMESRSLHG